MKSLGLLGYLKSWRTRYNSRDPRTRSGETSVDGHGLNKGTVIFIRKVAPLADPIEINVRGYELTLRKSEAELILVEKEESE